MKTWKIVTLLGAAVVVAALLTTSAFAVAMMGNPFGGMMGGGYGYGYNNYGYYNNYNATASAQYYQPVYPFQFGGGCIGGLGNGYGFGGMMRGYGYSTPYTYTGTQINITTALTIAQNYVASIGNPDLSVKEAEEYSANIYIQVYEKSTGTGAFELLIDKYTGSIYPEMGPNMMWNTKYGMMRSGILGGVFGTPTTTMPVSADQAKVDAQQWLNVNIPGAVVGEVFPFYGYYHVMAMVNGADYGMMSVNGYSGQVWYHTWHGSFIQSIDVN
jgi:hypothetical protein